MWSYVKGTLWVRLETQDNQEIYINTSKIVAINPEACEIRFDNGYFCIFTEKSIKFLIKELGFKED